MDMAHAITVDLSPAHPVSTPFCCCRWLDDVSIVPPFLPPPLFGGDGFDEEFLNSLNIAAEFNLGLEFSGAFNVLFTYVRYADPQSLLLQSRLPHYLKLDYLVTRASSGHT